MLPKTTEYALRALAHMAILPPDQVVGSADLADAARIPPHYVSKLMRRLVVAGLVQSRRGPGGGFTLARAASDIRFADVLDAVDFAADSGECVFGWGACTAQTPCPLHPAWARLREAFEQWAEESTLAEVRTHWAQLGDPGKPTG